MALRLSSASFEDATLGMQGSRTDDGQALSVLFDRLQVESATADTDTSPQVQRAEGVVQCEGSGWVSVQVRGSGVACHTGARSCFYRRIDFSAGHALVRDGGAK